MVTFQRHGCVLYGKIQFTAKASLTCESPVTLRDITLGVPTKIGAYTYISGPANLRGLKSIGRFCSLGNDINIGPGHHPLNWLSTSPFQYNAAFFDHPEIRGLGQTNLHYESPPEVIIENDVWIGSNVTIFRGVKVGNGAVIGAGSIVTKDVPNYAVVAGTPAKLIKYRFNQDIIDRLIKLQWWNYDLRGMKGVDFSSIETAINQLETALKNGNLEERTPKFVEIKENQLQ
jgi:acetyltransferase-like isoleucine patch superfamily enzyme